MAYCIFFLLLGSQILLSEATIASLRPNDIESCSRPLDLMLVIDSSGSVAEIWNQTIDFAEKLLSNFNIAEDMVRVGIIEFSMIANALVPLDSGTNLGKLYQALEAARYRPQNGETHTDLALSLASNVFRSAPRDASVPKVLAIITDGELTSGNFNDLNSVLQDLAYQNVEIFTISQGDDHVEEGLDKMASKPTYLHKFGLPAKALSSPYLTKGLATALCNVQPKPQQQVPYTGNGDAKQQESTTIVQAQSYKPEQQQTAQQATQSQNAQWKAQQQTIPQEGAWHQNLQQPVGNPKQTYPENPLEQPLPSLPVTKAGAGFEDATTGHQQTNVGQQALSAVPQCSVNVTKIGCYRDFGQVPRPLPVKLFEEKENNFHLGVKNPSFNKQAWQAFLPDFVCKCAKKAKDMKYWTFGVQNYNECFSGPDEGRYDEDGNAETSKCKDEKANDCNKDSKFCSGEDNANYVYTILTESHKAIVRIEYD